MLMEKNIFFRNTIDKLRLEELNTILGKYKAGKARLDMRVKSAENWWKMRNLFEEQKTTDPKNTGFRAATAWLHNTIAQKQAAAMEAYPEAVLVCTAKASQMIKQFFGNGFESRMMAVKEGDTLLLGKHNLTFVLAPMVHWPEVMVSYETTEKILFSADAFGTFGALYGPMFADEMNFDRDWLDDARRYYTNIVGKYGTQVQMLLNKAAGLEISLLCPLHGPMWRENLGYFIDKYQKWSTYTPESEGVLIVYASMYGHTENMAEIFASKINEAGVKELAVYNLSHTDCSYMIADAFKYSRILLVAPTYNNGLNPLMENFLHELAARFIQKRTFAIAENGTWMPASGKIMRSIVEEMKNCTVLEPTFTIKSALHPEQLSDMDTFINQFIHN